MVPRRTPGPASRRLTKAEVVALLESYDAGPIPALTAALASLLDRPGEQWPALVAAAPFSPARRAALLREEPDALDALAAELNEVRRLDPTPE